MNSTEQDRYGQPQPPPPPTPPQPTQPLPAYPGPTPYPQHYAAPPWYGCWGPPPPPSAPPRETSGLALASVILGVLWIYWLGSFLAVVLGHIALAQIKRHDQAGRELAVAGVILGWIGVGTFCLFFVPLFVLPWLGLLAA